MQKTGTEKRVEEVEDEYSIVNLKSDPSFKNHVTKSSKDKINKKVTTLSENNLKSRSKSHVSIKNIENNRSSTLLEAQEYEVN